MQNISAPWRHLTLLGCELDRPILSTHIAIHLRDCEGDLVTQCLVDQRPIYSSAADLSPAPILKLQTDCPCFHFDMVLRVA
jgi:hypothetical protein